MVVRVHVQELPVGGHQLGGQQLIDGHAILAAEETEAAAQGNPGNPHRSDIAEPGGEAVGCGGGGIFTGGQATFGPGRPVLNIDIQGFHIFHAEYDAAMRGAVAGRAVAAGANGQFQPGFSGQSDGALHVSRVGGRRMTAGWRSLLP